MPSWRGKRERERCFLFFFFIKRRTVYPAQIISGFHWSLKVIGYCLHSFDILIGKLSCCKHLFVWRSNPSRSETVRRPARPPACPPACPPAQCCIKLAFHLTYTMMHGSTKLKITRMSRPCLLFFLRCHLYHHQRLYRRRQDVKSVEEAVQSFARCKRFFFSPRNCNLEPTQILSNGFPPERKAAGLRSWQLLPGVVSMLRMSAAMNGFTPLCLHGVQSDSWAIDLKGHVVYLWMFETACAS